MRPEAQRIAIAEWCGWKLVETCYSDGSGVGKCWLNPEGVGMNLADYLSDLNAMHEAESKLEHPEAFASRLGPILLRDGSASNQDGTTAWHFAFAHATAAQRAEALLCTIGKWTE